MASESVRPARPTMADVAARAGVSRALVSIVFRDLPGASEATRVRVREVAAGIGYAPDQSARMLGRKRSRLLGVAFGVEHSFHGELVEALYPAAEARGYELVLSAVAPTRDEDRAVESLLAYRCEALVLIGPQLRTTRLGDLGTRVPLVVVARNVRHRSVDVVRTDDVDGAGQATGHLIGLGHRRIAHVDGGSAAGAAERRRGYRTAMERAGLAEHVDIRPGGLTEAAGVTAGARLTDRDGSGPTAVVAFNDRCAVGVIHGTTGAGRQVPAELSVVGFDDNRFASLPWVDLTTVRQDTGELAGATVDRAIDRVETHGGRSRSVIVAPQLVVRGSTRPVSR